MYDTHVYDSWGGVRWSSGTGSNDGKTVVIESTYTGHPYDPILGIYFAEARFYDAPNRQWLASDPIKSGLNWYEYVGGNPVTFWDFNGLWAVILNQKANENPPGPWDHRPELSDEDIARLEEHEKEVQLQKRQKKQQEKESSEREVLKAVAEQKRRQEQERAEWEAYYANPTEPYKPLEEFYEWNMGRQNNFNSATLNYFNQIFCPINNSDLMDIVGNPNQFALQYTVNAINETIQYIGRLTGYYDLTAIGNINVGAGMGDWTHGASIGFAWDTKGNSWALATKSDGASFSVDASVAWSLDASVSVMPGGSIGDWQGVADNLGGSLVLGNKGFGVDYVELIQNDGTRNTRLVFTAKISADKFALEGHSTHTITTPSKVWLAPFNYLEWLDKKAGEFLDG